MPTSKYARKLMRRSFARNFSDADWQFLCRDKIFISALDGKEFNLTLADQRANELLKRPVKLKPQITKSLQDLVPAGAS